MGLGEKHINLALPETDDLDNVISTCPSNTSEVRSTKDIVQIKGKALLVVNIVGPEQTH